MDADPQQISKITIGPPRVLAFSFIAISAAFAVVSLYVFAAADQHKTLGQIWWLPLVALIILYFALDFNKKLTLQGTVIKYGILGRQAEIDLTYLAAADYMYGFRAQDSLILKDRQGNKLTVGMTFPYKKWMLVWPTIRQYIVQSDVVKSETMTRYLDKNSAS